MNDHKEIMPDANCVTLPNGDCVGTGCMHDAPTFIGTPNPKAIAARLKDCADRGVEPPSSLLHEAAQCLRNWPSPKD